MEQAFHIPTTLENIPDHFSPKIIGEVNDVYIKLVKILGEKVPWHSHQHEDELFYILEGSLLMEIQGKSSFEMKKGDLFVVPKGINHRVSSKEECHIMLIENQSTKHTGKTIAEITKTIDQQKK